jgi:EAL domain-containing protein (putative c-di-GMP-specific phosphodiesterase class I)
MQLNKLATQPAAATDAERYFADYYDLKLTSAFQPIFSFAHRRPVGYEALLRASMFGDDVAPGKIFSIIRGRDELMYLDLLAREVHARNFVSQQADNCWLFLNVSPQVFVSAPRHAGSGQRLPTSHQLVPYRIVIEVVESAITDEAALVDAVRFYRDQGCLIALDDFGAGHSNFGRVWSIEPDIVKLDRNLTRQAALAPKMRRMLANLVSMLHENGSLVLMEGVESEAEALVALDVDVDLAQGYFFGKPQGLIDNLREHGVVPSDLYRKHRDASYRADDPQRSRQRLARQLIAYRDSVRALESDQAMDTACFRLLKQEGVECCYLLTADGVQVGDSLIAANGSKVCDPRYAPLFNTSGSNWYRRPFFQNAILNPGQVQISTPYLSLTGAYLCVTLSCALEVQGKWYVFGCDLNWDRLRPNAAST